MAFIAECPFCHIKLQKVPDYREGSSVECPRCKNLFTLTVMISPPKPRASTPKIVVPKVAPVPAAMPAPAPVLTPADLPVVPHHLEPAPPAPAREMPRRVVAAPSIPEVRAVEAHQDSLPRAKPVHNVGVAAVLLAGLTVIVASLVGLYYVTLTLGVAAIVCALVALISAPSRTGIATLPLFALVVSVVVLAISVLWPTLFGFESPALKDLTEGAGGITVLPRLDTAKGKNKTADESPWVDASKDAIELSDIRVEIVSAVLRPVELTDAKGKRISKHKYLTLTLRLNNLGNPRAMGYTSWGQSEATMPILKDNQNLTYQLQTFGHGIEIPGRISRATLAPGKPIEDLLVYPPPADHAQWLRLELPGTAIGVSGTVRFEIPLRMISS